MSSSAKTQSKHQPGTKQRTVDDRNFGFGEQVLGYYFQLETEVMRRPEPLNRILLQAVSDGTVNGGVD